MSVTNKLVSFALVAGMSATFSAQGAMISFGGVKAADGSGLTSEYVSAGSWVGGFRSNVINPTSGWFIETFDEKTKNLLLADVFPGIYQNTPDGFIEVRTEGCGVNSGTALDISGTGGFGVQKGNTGSAAHAAPSSPDANNTCFAYAPKYGVTPANADIIIDYSNFLQSQLLQGTFGNDTIGYVGMYFGSIDTYNAFEFGNVVNDVFEAITFSIDGLLGSFTRLEGSHLLDVMQTQSGNRNTSNNFVNMFFDQGENFTALRMINTTTRALELDNIVVGMRSAPSIPEPATISIFGLSLLGLGASVRRRKAK